MSTFTAELTAATTAMIDRTGVDEQTPARGFDSALWSLLDDASFTMLALPEEAGGGGADLADALAVATLAAQRGVLAPLIEHGILGGWLAASAGHSVASSTTTVALGRVTCTARTDGAATVLDGTVTDVPFAADAETVVVMLPPAAGETGSTVAVAPLSGSGVTISADTDLTGISLADITFDATPLRFHGHSQVTADEFARRGALAYAAATAGAARGAADQTVRHASERTQFGRPLTRFQAVQQRLASQAALAAMMEIAVEDATAAADSDPAATAAAKAVTAMSAATVAAVAHQVHGALGTTSEHRLGRFTTMLWSWRDRCGAEQAWADHLGALVLDDGIDVWDLVAGTTGPAEPSSNTKRSRS
ncbi:acyl-CoA dehydrogenase family protein [Tomitella gaofuii]|uniref:acyl-CoA dehydrogenase family protein n=1 Tax=Tomitella gaofuii TaxID=2760083 RepID=UPI0015FE22F0|nr:acyl-CoA dehydrogenase family protein [Tomitella gaofuii]